MSDFQRDLDNKKGLLDYAFSSNAGIAAGVGGAAYVGSPLLKTAIRHTAPVQRYLSKAGTQASTMIGGYYAPGAEKGKLAFQHIFGIGGEKNVNKETINFLTNAIADQKEGTALGEFKAPKKGRPKIGAKGHKFGMASELLDDVNRALPSNQRIGTPFETHSGLRWDYTKVNPNDVTVIKKIQSVVHSGKLGVKSVAEANFFINEQAIKERALVTGDTAFTGKANRQLRHERAKTEFVKHIHGQRPNLKIIKDAGFSAPEQSSAKNIFKGIHKDVMGNAKRGVAGWGLNPFDRITVSQVISQSDKTALTRGLKKEVNYIIGEYVTKNAKNINSIAERRKLVTNIVNRMATGRHGLTTIPIHPQSPQFQTIIDDFMKKSYVKNGRLHMNFSPSYKPHFFMGGTNANAVFYKNINGKFKYDILVSDKYDMLKPEKVVGGRIQRKRHFTVSHHTNDKRQVKGRKVQGLYRPTKYSSDIAKFKEAVRAGDKSDIIKYGKKVGRKATVLLKQNYLSTKNPVVKAAAFILSKGKLKL
jgi:hypothetical protein